MKSNFSDRLKKAMVMKDLKQSDLARITGIDKSLISNYINGNYSPKQENIYTLSKTLGVDPSWLLGFDVEIDMEAGLSNIDNAWYIETTDKYVMIPILGRVPAGIPIEAVEDVIGYESIPASMIKGANHYFALKIVGDSMFPEYMDGDIIIVKQASTCDSGDDCIVMVNGDDATFKRVILQEDGMMLKPLNSNYEPFYFSRQDIEEKPVTIIGVVMELHRKKK